MQPDSTGSDHVVNYYTVLGLPQPRGASPATLSKDELKVAYHRALLIYHPDKISRSNGHPPSARDPRDNAQAFTIDEIVAAYQTLMEPNLKIKYDNQLINKRSIGTSSPDRPTQNGTHLGVEIYDLEELEYDQDKERWFRSCRCGDENGYTVTEAELEMESKNGEIYVGCQGCSLFVKVLFAMVEENDIT